MLGRLARFEDDRGIETVRVAKSESRETTFDADLRGLGQLEPQLRRLTEQLCATLERQDQRGRTVGIKVRYDDFSTVTRARSVAAPVNELDEVWPIAVELLRRLDPPRPGSPDRRARGRPGRGAGGRGRGGPAQPDALGPRPALPLTIEG